MSDLDTALVTLTAVDRSASLLRRRAVAHVLTGPDAGLRHAFEGRLRIGSNALAELRLADTRVSGMHCELIIDTELRVRDLGSKNGTWVNGVHVFDAILPSGVTLTLGDTQLRIEPSEQSAAVELSPADRFQGLVGRLPAMRALYAQLQRLAPSSSTVLLQGETGTGKECVAEALHLASPRHKGPLTIVDCGALPAGLIESELFGHARGAFTGAVGEAAGAFERADGGTLLLDEIGELPLELQPKLLRAIESREVRRLGAAKPVAFDVRIIAATHRDLQIETAHERFREDLYYRLAVVTLEIPPLRDRLEDVPLLAVHLLTEMGLAPADCLSVESLAALTSHDWPGNVRELRNALERAAVMLEPPRPLPRPQTRTTGTTQAPKVDLAVPLRDLKQRAIDDLEAAYVGAMLKDCGGNISETARRAGVDRMSIHRIVQRLKLKGEE